PNAAVRSRYFRPSASQTFTPLARSHTIGHDPSGSVNSTFRDSYSRSRSRVCCVFICLWLDASLLRRPDDFVHLNLEPDWQRVGDDLFRQFLSRDGSLAFWNFLQRLVLLFRSQRMHPRNKQRTDRIEFVFGDLPLRPIVVLPRPDDELDLIGVLQVR